MTTKFSDIKYVVKGSGWTTETLVIVGLMRRLGLKEIHLAELDITQPQGMIIGDKIEIQELGDN
jgi:hypothetical protein